jgi:hypothetical protein
MTRLPLLLTASAFIGYLFNRASYTAQKHILHARESRAMRENLSERQIDHALMDSFPCSDPPAWY